MYNNIYINIVAKNNILWDYALYEKKDKTYFKSEV